MKLDLATTYSRVIKYSAEDEEKGFHAALESDPEDETALLAYVDWLKDHDREAEAELFRRNIASEKSQRRSKVIAVENKPSLPHNLRAYGQILSHPELFVSSRDKHDLNVGIRANVPSKANPNKYFWLNGDFTYEEAAPIVKELRARGYKAAGIDWNHSDTVDKLTKELHDKS